MRYGTGGWGVDLVDSSRRGSDLHSSSSVPVVQGVTVCRVGIDPEGPLGLDPLIFVSRVPNLTL